MTHRKKIILPSAYFGPLQYFTRFTEEAAFLIEQYDHYMKQTYRNRCVIAGANGPLVLSIPVKRNKGGKTLMKDVRIDYDTPWQKLHYRGILAAYGSSPFFEFYFDEIEALFRKRHVFLKDLNQLTTEISLRHLNLHPDICLSDEFQQAGEGDEDFRDLISPKRSIKEDPFFNPREYTQVFRDKIGFLPNLSILDLIFNLGPEAVLLLRKMSKRN